MTRLPADNFIPPGTMDAGLEMSLAGLGLSGSGHASSSVISPLTLPGGVQYFDTVSRPSVTSHPNNHLFSHMNGGSRDPPRAQPATFLSPHLTPIPSHAQYQLPVSKHHRQQRAASLSPSRGPVESRSRDDGMEVRGGRTSERNVGRPLQRITSPSAAVPVDTISGTGSGLITVRRPAVRAAAPTADSMSVDSQISAAGHDYKKLERMRQAFDDERRLLQASRDKAEEIYQGIIEEMEADHARQKSHWETEKYELQMQVMQLQHRLEESESHADPKLNAFQPGSSSTKSPPRHLDLLPLASREDRSSTDSSAMLEDLGLPSKVIDVQEVHGELEGIHLKENFIKKETFTDTPSSSGSKDSSGKGSPPQHPDDAKSLARARSIRALRADAQSRLTMNAGHTPTVSLSIAHTGTSNTVVSSGSNTPTLTSGDGCMSSDDNKPEPAEPVPTGAEDDHMPAILEPSDEDPELKGPLTLRNMPAKDELFLRRLSDKLEKVTSGEDATPTVLKHSDDEDEAPTAADAAREDLDSDTSGDAQDEAEEDIPLKLRKTSSNFGKPFGIA